MNILYNNMRLYNLHVILLVQEHRKHILKAHDILQRVRTNTCWSSIRLQLANSCYPICWSETNKDWDET